MSQHDYLLKVLLVGDSSVGKSCLLMQYIDKKFVSNMESTVGVEFGCKTIKVEESNFRLQIWDTVVIIIVTCKCYNYYKLNIFKSYYYLLI